MFEELFQNEGLNRFPWMLHANNGICSGELSTYLRNHGAHRIERTIIDSGPLGRHRVVYPRMLPTAHFGSSGTRISAVF